MSIEDHPQPEWDEAFLRVESYLRAHRLESRIRLNRMATQIIAAAQAESAKEADAVKRALRHADERLEAWLARVLGPDLVGTEGSGRRGRLALLMADVPRRWPRDFLAEDEPPAELVAAMRAGFLEAGPELAFSNMAPRPLDLGPVAYAAGETWRTLRRWPQLRAVHGVAAAGGAGGVAHGGPALAGGFQCLEGGAPRSFRRAVWPGGLWRAASGGGLPRAAARRSTWFSAAD